MNNKNRRPLVRMRFILGFIILLSIPLVVSYFYIPGQIHLIVGEEHLFNFDLPLKANIKSGEELIVKEMERQVACEGLIDLNKPLSVTMLQEGRAEVSLSLFGVIPIKTVAVHAVPYEELIPCGQVVGIRVNTAGILVLGVGELDSDAGYISPCKGIIETGDLIMSCNDTLLMTKDDLRECIEHCTTPQIQLRLMRKGLEKEVEVTPVYSKREANYKIGLWIKDSTQGIGTITYIHPKTGHFGALGHGITDGDTRTLIPVKDGELMSATINYIKKGVKGNPGEVSGVIDYEDENVMGEIYANNALGIYGYANAPMIESQPYAPIPIAFQDEVHEGVASILVDLTGEGVQEYSVAIQKVSKYSNEPSKSMVIHITDKELLALTNGIVQGMSGSPILQDGKLIGAVTHVFVNDPTRGYGIFIENMLETAENMK